MQPIKKSDLSREKQQSLKEFYKKKKEINKTRKKIKQINNIRQKELRNYRAYHLALPDKDDNADALALACYGIDYSSTTRYVATRDATTARIRELVLRLQHLNRIKNPISNRLRQD